MEIDRRAFIAGLGGAAAVAAMDSEAKADALEHYMEERLDEQVAAGQAGQGGQPEKFPTVAEIEARIDQSNVRRGAGSLFASTQRLPHLIVLPPHWSAQPPCTHTSPGLHCLPHAPQLFGSRLSGTQSAPQSE